MTFASRMQHKIYWGPLKKPLEWSLKTILAPWSYIASVLYHDLFWYPLHYRRMKKVMNSDWGKLFHNWEDLELSPDDSESSGWQDLETKPGGHSVGGVKLLWKGIKILGTSIKEAPEFESRKRHKRHDFRSQLYN
jgi:hypothetical protein